MNKYIFISLFFLLGCSSDEFTNVCQYQEPSKVYCQVTNWVNADSVLYTWQNGTPLEVITYSPDSIELSHKYFFSDDVLIMKIQSEGFWYWGAHWFPPSPSPGEGELVSIRFYETPELSKEVSYMRTYIVPQWYSPNGITSYEDTKEIVCMEYEIE